MNTSSFQASDSSYEGGVWLGMALIGFASALFLLKLFWGPDILTLISVNGSSLSAVLISAYVASAIITLWNGMHCPRMKVVTTSFVILSVLGIIATGSLEYIHSLVG